MGAVTGGLAFARRTHGQVATVTHPTRVAVVRVRVQVVRGLLALLFLAQEAPLAFRFYVAVVGLLHARLQLLRLRLEFRVQLKQILDLSFVLLAVLVQALSQRLDLELGFFKAFL